MITDRDARPLFGEGFGYGSADASRTARNKNLFAGEVGNNEARSGHQGAFWAERSIGIVWLVVARVNWPIECRGTSERRNVDASYPNARAPDHANLDSREASPI